MSGLTAACAHHFVKGILCFWVGGFDSPARISSICNALLYANTIESHLSYPLTKQISLSYVCKPDIFFVITVVILSSTSSTVYQLLVSFYGILWPTADCGSDLLNKNSTPKGKNPD